MAEENNSENLDDPKSDGAVESGVEGSKEKQNDSAEASKKVGEELRKFFQPFYRKALLGTLVLALLVWGGLSMCSSPSGKLKKNFYIGLDPSWYPLQTKIREKNMTAFVETLLRDFAAAEGVNIKIIETTQEKLMPEFNSKKFDAIVSLILPMPTSTGGYPYMVSSPIYRLGPVLVVGENSSYTSLGDMNGKVVGLAESARFEINIAEYPNIIFSGYNDFLQALADLNNKKIDGVVVDSLQAKTFAHGLFAGKLKIADFYLTKEGILIIFHKNDDNQQFIEKFNAFLKEFRANGFYGELLKQWQLIDD